MTKLKSVIAKFKCNTVTKLLGTVTQNERQEVRMTAVTTGSTENKVFSKYTPVGSLNLTIDHVADAFDHFEEGKEYYLTIEEAPTGK